MSKPTFINSSVIYHDNSTEYNIDARGNNDIASIIRNCNAEDVTTERVQEEKNNPSVSLPFFVPNKLHELGTYTEQEFEKMYHDAVKGGAPKLAPFLKHYRDLSVLISKGIIKKRFSNP